MLRPIAEIYGLQEDETWPCYDYQPLIESIGVPLIQADDDDYQGDTFIVFEPNENGYGLLVFGWGSCSGCDALQGCETVAQVEALRSGLVASISYFPSIESLKLYLSQNEGLLWYHHSEAFAEFKKKVGAIADA